MPKLKDISFNFNNIATLSMNIFLTFPNLKYIGLSYNKLVKIDGFFNIRYSMNSINTITVDGNLFPCSTLLDIVQYGKKKPSIEFGFFKSDIKFCNNSKIAAIKKIVTTTIVCNNSVETDTLINTIDSSTTILNIIIVILLCIIFTLPLIYKKYQACIMKRNVNKMIKIAQTYDIKAY